MHTEKPDEPLKQAVRQRCAEKNFSRPVTSAVMPRSVTTASVRQPGTCYRLCGRSIIVK